MFCGICGKELSDGAQFCGNCGTAIPVTSVPNTSTHLQPQCSTQNTSTSSTTTRKKSKASEALIIIVIGLFVCGVIFGIIYVIDALGKGIEYVADKVESAYSSSKNTQQSQKGTTSNSNNSQKTNTNQSLGNLKNTTWNHYSSYTDTEYFGSGFSGNDRTGWTYSLPKQYEVTRAREQEIDFGNGNFLWQVLQGPGSNRTGTYRVSGDIVYFTFSDGSEIRGQLIGNSLSFSDISFRRIK